MTFRKKHTYPTSSPKTRGIQTIYGHYANYHKSRKDKYSTQFRYKRYIDSWRFGYIDLIDQTQQKSIVCPSGFTWGQGWGVLNKCWIGYKIAKNKEQSLEKMQIFAKKIQDIQYDLGIKKTDFSHIGLPGEVLVLYDKPPKKSATGNRYKTAQAGIEIEYDEKSRNITKNEDNNVLEDGDQIAEDEVNTEAYLQDIWLTDKITKTERTE